MEQQAILINIMESFYDQSAEEGVHDYEDNQGGTDLLMSTNEESNGLEVIVISDGDGDDDDNGENIQDSTMTEQGENINILHRRHYLNHSFVSRRRWTPFEDAKLCEKVAIHGMKNWKTISQALTGRTSNSCRFRWGKLLVFQQAFDNRWSEISKFLPPSVKRFMIAHKPRQQIQSPDSGTTSVNRSSLQNEGTMISNTSHAYNGNNVSHIINPSPSFASNRSQAADVSESPVTRPSQLLVIPTLNLSLNMARCHNQTATIPPLSPPSPQFIDFLGVGSD